MDTPVLAAHNKLTFNSSVRTLDVVSKIYKERWSIGTDGQKKSKKSVLSFLLDDDDDVLTISYKKLTFSKNKDYNMLLFLVEQYRIKTEIVRY